jgi:molybdopterin-containing oxidoreductase family iron-sulfur binding subunit
MESKKLWNSLAELRNEPEAMAAQKKEFAVDPFEQALQEGTSSNRRNFLKVFGFSVSSAAVLTACSKTPVKYSLPYVDKPSEILPSVANYYASSFFDGSEYVSVLVKSREGRPIKIEGNPSSTVTKGGASAAAFASVLGLYDTNRYEVPSSASGINGSWEKADAEIGQALAGARSIRILSSTLLSPSSEAVIARFVAKYPTTKWIQYDADSASGILEANEANFGKRSIPSYHFDKADLIVSIGADFLGTWLSPTEYTRQFATRRKVSKQERNLNRLIVFESHLSLTGSNADLRVPYKPSQEGQVVLKLYNEIASLAGKPRLAGDGADLAGNAVTAYAKELWNNQAKSLVVSGSNDPNVQQLVNGINVLLGNYGKTIDLINHANIRRGSDKEVQGFLEELKAGQVDAVFFVDTNPVYTLPNGKELGAALANVKVSVSFSHKPDETANACNYRLPSHHWLEAWGDAQPYKGSFSIIQPNIRPLYKTRAWQDSLLKWSGESQDYVAFQRAWWKENIFSVAKDNLGYREFLKNDLYSAGRTPGFEDFWRYVVSVGVLDLTERIPGVLEYKGIGEGVVSAITSEYKATADKTLEAVVYSKVSIGQGVDADNPWLQEMPDPITKATWDNYVCVSPAYATEKGLKQTDVVTVSAGGAKFDLPVLILPGLQRYTVAIAAGYGRTVAGPAAQGIGANANVLRSFKGSTFRSHADGVTLTPKGETYPIALTQTHGTVMGRAIVYETTLKDYDKDTAALVEKRGHIQHHNKLYTLYKDYPMTGHRWAMVIDLNSCTGCGACVVSCQSENNIPVVGKKEVLRGREMHWIRIDRYFSTDGDPSGNLGTQHAGVTVKESATPSKFEDESAEALPEVVFQPMMCQHCDNAPCENVCPVLATVHSSEGLNQQAYNRCFGTRYCANNCPYKVRRFNWLDYTNNGQGAGAFLKTEFIHNPGVEDNTFYDSQDQPAKVNVRRMVLNPDVTVRARGVMEKCSFCVQRLQAGKLTAKKEGRKLQDGDVMVACQQSCPAQCITFGDLNDPESAVSKLYASERGFQVLEDLKVLPSITYLAKVRNQDEVEQQVRKALRSDKEYPQTA